MSYVYSRYGELIVAENAADERSVAAALKDVDPDLVLTWENQGGVRRWEVRKVVSRDHPAPLVRAWVDDLGEPLPLSHRLVDEVKRARYHVDLDAADRANARMQERATRDSDDGILEVIRDNLPRVQGKKMSVLHRGVHLRRSRWKNRQNGTGWH